MPKKLLVICNLKHSSPRIPGLLGPFSKEDWVITLLTKKLPENYVEELGFPEDFVRNVKIMEIGKDGDSLSKFRRVLTLLGFSSNRSFLEQAREISESDRVKGFASGIFKMYMTFFAFPDLEKNWIRKACSVAQKLDGDERYDFILSSSPFPSMHIAASRITKNRSCTWIADFRDPWVGNPVYGYGRFRRYFEKKLEQKTLKAAKALITVSDEYSDILKSIHNKPTFVIPNGYTIYPETSSNYSETPSNGLEENKTQKIFSHTGNIYRDFHDIKLLIKSIGELKQEGFLSERNFRLNFYGRYEAEITRLVTELEVSELVVQMGYVSRRESIEIQRHSDCLIFFNWEAGNQGGLSHLKFYEYLASGTPILTIGRGITRYTEIIELENVGSCGFDLTSVKVNIKNILNSNQRQNLRLEKYSPKLYKYSYNHRSLVLENILRTI